MRAAGWQFFIPDIILKLGTKEVLYQTRDLGWGCDTHLYRTMDQMRRELPARLAEGHARVLKQYRGHSGNGVWKVELADDAGVTLPPDQIIVRARHAQRGCVEEKIPLSEFFRRCEPYFSGEGRLIDQAFQPRLPEGMIRCGPDRAGHARTDSRLIRKTAVGHGSTRKDTEKSGTSSAVVRHFPGGAT